MVCKVHIFQSRFFKFPLYIIPKWFLILTVSFILSKLASWNTSELSSIFSSCHEDFSMNYKSLDHLWKWQVWDEQKPYGPTFPRGIYSVSQQWGSDIWSALLSISRCFQECILDTEFSSLYLDFAFILAKYGDNLINLSWFSCLIFKMWVVIVSPTGDDWGLKELICANYLEQCLSRVGAILLFVFIIGVMVSLGSY